jgi:hypothetical protein
MKLSRPSLQGKKTRLDFFDSFFHQGKNEWKTDKEGYCPALRSSSGQSFSVLSKGLSLF